MIKKAASLTDITLSIILGITLFLGMYSFFVWSANDSGLQ